MNLTQPNWNWEPPQAGRLYICQRISLRFPEKLKTYYRELTVASWAKFDFIVVIIKICLGLTVHRLPRWRSGEGSTCQCRRYERHEFDPGSRRSPREGNGSLSSILAWEIPWTEEPGGLQSMGSQRVRHNWVYTHTHTHTYTLSKALTRAVRPISHFIHESVSSLSIPQV